MGIASGADFQKLLEPGSIGQMTLRNRIFMSPMGDRYGKEGYVTEQQKDYYEARARGGAGLVIVGATCIDYPLGHTGPLCTYVDDDKFIPGLAGLAQVIKRHGARAAIQLVHAGGCAQSHLQAVAPSAVPHYEGYNPPRALTVGEIKDMVGLHVKAAERASKAGFDAVEIHGAHGWLISEFLSAAWNKRQDEYGGSVKNRARFLLEIVRATKEAVGQDYPVWCRYNCEEPDLDGGITLAEAKEIARMLQDAGADAIHVSRDPHTFTGMPSFFPRGFLLPLAQEIKKVVAVPVLAAGWITPELGETALREQKTDFVGLGRSLIADPDLLSKLASGRLNDIAPCIRCNRCFGERKTWDIFVSTGGIQCSVNAAVGRERQFEIKPAKQAKKVLVVGGGPAGMEAARVAALRGPKVMLYERSDRLGGALNLATIPPYKDTVQELTNYLTTQLTKLGVQVKLGTEVSPEMVGILKPDVVILASGAKSFIPEIPGIQGRNVVTSESVLTGKAKVGHRVVVIGGEMVGSETAEFLADSGRKITITTLELEVATKTNWTIRRALLIRLAQKGVVMLSGVKYERVTDRGVVITTKEGGQQLIEADTIVLADGAKPNGELFEALKGKVPEIYRVGDCVEPRGVMEAISEGAQVARSI